MKDIINTSIENAEKFIIARFRFYLQPLEPIFLSDFKGATLRGGFGYIFKKTVCINFYKACRECLLQQKCVYAYIFETPFPDYLTEKTSFNIAYPPHPYILEPPFDSKAIFNPDDELIFNLVLIGKSIEYLPYFIFVFDELGKIGLGKDRGKYKLNRVEDIKGEMVYHNGRLKDKINQITFQDIIHKYQRDTAKQYSEIRIHFLTPTRFVLEEKLVKEINFKEFITNLLRRISLLSIFHCAKKIDFDYLGLIEDTNIIESKIENWKWHDWGRYSTKQKQRVKLGGFLGDIYFSGNLNRFIPFIKLGEYIHIGKQTSFGLGKYEIME